MVLIHPAIIIILLITLLIVVVLSFVFIFKHEEKQAHKILWSLFVLFIPFLGAFIYIIKYIVEVNRKKVQVAH
jgi:O-antigen/teichoic acid export membrane protein